MSGRTSQRRPTTPGGILREEFLVALGLSQQRRAVTAALELRLGAFTLVR